MATPSKSAPIMSSDSFEQNGEVTESNANMLQCSLSQQHFSSLDGPVAILWDIENCSVPSDVHPEDVAGNIRMALRVHPVIQGAVMMFSAYGDFNAFPRRLREGCQRTGVKLVDVPNGRKDAADKAILVDMFLFALDHPPPSSIMLISGDVDFAPALHILGQRGYTIILVIPAGVGVSSALCNAGKFVWDWPSVSRGEGFVPPSRGLVPPRGGQIGLAGYFMGCHINDNPDGQNAKFTGEADPEKADLWVQEMEKIFGILQTPEDAKVGVATGMLLGDAEYWWREAKQIMEANHVEITWISFRNAFLEKYFPVSAREEKEAQFLRLYQGNMTVSEYAAKMELLSKHFRFSQVQVDEAYLCSRFVMGLCNDIEESVRPLGIRHFQQLVDKCCEIEMIKNRRRSSQGSGGPIRPCHQNKGKSDKGKHNQKKPYQRPQGKNQASGQYRSTGGTSRSHGAQPQKQEVVCFKCNKPGHYANACNENVAFLCWNCNKLGHMVKDCRAPKAEAMMNTPTGKRPTAQRRVCTMSSEEAANAD